MCIASGPSYSSSATSVIWYELWISIAATCNSTVILSVGNFPFIAMGNADCIGGICMSMTFLNSFLLLITNSNSKENPTKKVMYSVGDSTVPLGL